MEDELPNGSRSNHVYQSPHFKPNSSYNYWNDLNHNQSVRNKWENKSSNASLIEDFDIISGRKLFPMKNANSVSDLISMRSEAPVKHLETSMVTSFNPQTPARTSKIIPTKTLNLGMPSPQAIQGQQQDTSTISKAPPLQHQVRFLYSQIDLSGYGGDTTTRSS